MSKGKTNRRRFCISRKRNYRKNNSRNKTARGGEGYWKRKATERQIRKAKPATLWSPWRYAKETGRMGENVKKAALEKLSRRQAALRIDNSKSEILRTAQNANAAFKRGFDDIHNHRYSEGVNKLTSATDQLERDTYANAAHATTDFNKGIAGLDSKLHKANNVFGNSMTFENGSEADSAAVDEIIRKAADDVAKENARRLPPASKRGTRKSK